MNYKDVHKKAIYYMQMQCGTCYKAYRCKHFKDEDVYVKRFTRLRDDGKYCCECCTEYSHRAMLRKDEGGQS